MTQNTLPRFEWQKKSIRFLSQIVQAYLDKQLFENMDWSAQSPDLNPIEHTWYLLDKKSCEDVLFENLKSAWNSITKGEITTLIESMPRRCEAVIRSLTVMYGGSEKWSFRS